MGDDRPDNFDLQRQLTAQDAKLASIEGKLDQILPGLAVGLARLDAHDQKHNTHEKSFEKLNERLDKSFKEISESMAGGLTAVNVRVDDEVKSREQQQQWNWAMALGSGGAIIIAILGWIMHK